MVLLLRWLPRDCTTSLRRLGGGETEKALAAWGERRSAAAAPRAQARQRRKLKEGASTSAKEEEEERWRLAELLLLVMFIAVAFSEQSDLLQVVRDSAGAAAPSPEHTLGRTAPPRGIYRGAQTACSPTA